MNDPLSRHLILPARGHLMITTDLHGNLEDFLALREKFDGLRASHDDVHWAMLGDLVHGPDEEAQHLAPDLYGYPDDSWTLVEQAAALRREHPDRFHLVLGNHDHGHVGGPHLPSPIPTKSNTSSRDLPLPSVTSYETCLRAPCC